MPRGLALTLMFCAGSVALGQVKAPAPVQQETPMAHLGAVTRAPQGDEAKALGLPFAVRTQGQVVATVEANGPMAQAGIKPGDAILALDANTLYSRDDVDDFLRVTKPGTKVTASVARARSGKKEKLTVPLGSRKVTRSSGIAWRHAGLAQLEKVIEIARDDRKRILIGLSGAET